MKPLMWYDHFNDVIWKDAESAAMAKKGGNFVTALYDEESVSLLRDDLAQTKIACEWLIAANKRKGEKQNARNRSMRLRNRSISKGKGA